MKMFKKLVSMLVIALFVVSFAGVAVSQEMIIIKGEIASISADTGTVAVQDESGKVYTLTAGPDVDLKAFSAGDKVSVECGSDGVIKSITK